MGELTKSFPPTPPTSLISFDFTDFIESVGIVIYNLFTSEDSEGESEGMLKVIVGSSNIDTDMVSGGSNEKNFDLSAFTVPITVRGTATITIPVLFNGTATGNRSWTFVINIMKVVDAAEETLVSVTSQTIVQINQAEKYQLFNVRLVIPKTRFKKGDILRTNIILTGITNSGNIGNAGWGHDPLNRDGDATFPIIPSTNANKTTKSNISIPYEVKL